MKRKKTVASPLAGGGGGGTGGAAGQQGQGLNNAIASVIVRKMPADFVGDPIRSCNHFQWTWCPGLPGNPKCQVCSR